MQPLCAVHMLTHTWCCGQSLSAPAAGVPSLTVQRQHGRVQERIYLAFTYRNLLQDYPECRLILCAVTTIANLLLGANGFLLRGAFALFTLRMCYLRTFWKSGDQKKIEYKGKVISDLSTVNYLNFLKKHLITFSQVKLYQSNKTVG